MKPLDPKIFGDIHNSGHKEWNWNDRGFVSDAVCADAKICSSWADKDL
jgi:hypothetical protein